jgi:polygalacturonase
MRMAHRTPYDHTHRIAATLDGAQITDDAKYTYEVNHADLTLGPGATDLDLPKGDDSTITGAPAEGNPASCAGKFVPFPQ